MKVKLVELDSGCPLGVEIKPESVSRPVGVQGLYLPTSRALLTPGGGKESTSLASGLLTPSRAGPPCSPPHCPASGQHPIRCTFSITQRNKRMNPILSNVHNKTCELGFRFWSRFQNISITCPLCTHLSTTPQPI